ncbi:hypothetical protein [Baekduia sp. Peel2402]|uniref:hypothetical protein n=1 Tax=Baekduia sp. Peel2402 TaxID=3458296 RepID=UPI00403E556E
MSHRSCLLRLIPVLVGVVALAAAPAGAETIPVPADAPTVLAATPAVPAVIAFVHDGALCAALQETGAPRPATIDDSDSSVPSETGGCSNGPLPVLAPSSVRAMPDLHHGDVRIVLGVTGTDGASVQLRRRGAVIGTAATSAPLPLPDGAADLRLYAAGIPYSNHVDTWPDEIAVLDATGTVRHVTDHDADLELFSPPHPLAASRVVRRGRIGGVTWTLTTTPYEALASTPLEPDRHLPVVCVTFDGNEYEKACDGGQPDEVPLDVQFEIDCGATGSRAVVIARPAVRRVVAVLGDGRRVAVRLVPLPGAAIAGTRVGAFVGGRRMAVRGLLGLDAGGRTVARVAAGLPPNAVTGCGTDTITDDDEALSFYENGPPLKRGAHAARVADDGFEVCVAVDRTPRAPQDCATPRPDPAEAFLRAVATAEGHHVYGIVPADVAAARLTLDDGTTKTVAATAIAGYAGRYAGVMRIVEADIPAARTALRQAFLDARGRVLGQWVGPSNSGLKAVAGLGRPGGVPATLHAGRYTGVLSGRSATCLTLGALRWTDDCQITTVFNQAPLARVFVDCASRRTIVLSLLPSAKDRLVLRTSRGAVVHGRTVALPSRVASRGARAAAVAVVRSGLRELRLAGAKAVRLNLPSAREQCGYGLSITGEGTYPAAIAGW